MQKVKFRKKKQQTNEKNSKQTKPLNAAKLLTLNKPHAFPKKTYLFAGYHLGCVAELIYPRLVINVCKAAPISLFWVKNELNASTLVLFEFPFNSIGK